MHDMFYMYSLIKRCFYYPYILYVKKSWEIEKIAIVSEMVLLSDDWALLNWVRNKSLKLSKC